MTFKWRSKKVDRQMRCDLEQTRGDRYVGSFTGPRMVDAFSTYSSRCEGMPVLVGVYRGGDEPMMTMRIRPRRVSPILLSYQFHGRLTATTVGQCFIHLVYNTHYARCVSHHRLSLFLFLSLGPGAVTLICIFNKFISCPQPTSARLSFFCK